MPCKMEGGLGRGGAMAVSALNQVNPPFWPGGTAQPLRHRVPACKVVFMWPCPPLCRCECIINFNLYCPSRQHGQLAATARTPGQDSQPGHSAIQHNPSSGRFPCRQPQSDNVTCMAVQFHLKCLFVVSLDVLFVLSRSFPVERERLWGRNLNQDMTREL